MQQKGLVKPKKTSEWCTHTPLYSREYECHCYPQNQLETWMQEAIEEASHALPLDVPVGCTLRHKGKIFAACNQREQDQDPLGHAELLALQTAAQATGNWRLTDSILVVTLEPCPMCAAAIVQSRVSTLIFGAYDPLQGACGSRYNLTGDGSGLTVIGGILEARCKAQLTYFFARKRD